MATQDEREAWDKRFDGEGYLFGTEPNGFLAAQRHLMLHGGQALAIADGEGRNGVFLAEAGMAVRSVDLSPVAQAKAKRLATERGVSIAFELADLESWNWPTARYDLIAGIFIQFAPPAARSLIFERCKQALKPGGYMLLEGYAPRQIGYGTGGPSNLAHLYTIELLRDAFADLEILHLEDRDVVLAEGERHKGLSAVVDLVAQKPRR